MMDSTRLLQLVLFTSLAVISYAVYENYFGGKSGQLFEPFTKGYALTGVTMETTDERGEITTTIESPAVIHYADSKKTLIQQPLITLHEKEGNWIFQSAVGEINAEQTEIYFPQKVVINLNNPFNTQEVTTSDQLTIETSELVVDVANKTGKTAVELELTQLGSYLSGLGAVVDFKQQEIEILSKMYAEFKN